MKSTRTVANPAHDGRRQQIGLHSMLKVQIIIDFVGACFVRDASEAKANRPSFIVKFFCKRVLAITSKAHPFSNPGEANNIRGPGAEFIGKVFQTRNYSAMAFEPSACRPLLLPLSRVSECQGEKM